ncbi:MAG: hypothetical protein L0271_24730 [Gemmatimonadetes bacterium]|nr:hypothetical protein [Gemmatimonadota bacterium]
MNRRTAAALSFVLAGLVWSAGGSAQHPFSSAGGWDPAIPTPRSVLGYQVGERFTPHHLITRYFERLAAASGRIRLDTLGHTFEGREVLMLVITSEANHARVDRVLAASARVADPRGASAAELDAAIASLPAVVWLGFTVHGGEASGVEAAIALAYQLAAGTDADTRAILDSTVVLIDPVQNPDGHERHAQDVMRMRGAFGVPVTPGAMIHSGNWPGPRTSHYAFDLNRDWFILSHPETRARLSAFTRWWPHAAVDLHEMGSSSTYFFAPPMEPIHVNIHATIHKWWRIYAASNAAAFDAHGWSFFTREGYDEFYPGYGPSWPIFSGAVGMTYEQASSSGGAIRRNDGTVLTLQDAAHHHYTAAWSTALATARRRTERLRDYLEFRTTAIAEGERGPLRAVVIERDAQGRSDTLVARLLAAGIEVHRLSEATSVRAATRYGSATAGTASLAAGAWVIDLAQPQGRLARTLLEPDARLDSTFIADELERRRTGLGNRFYDVTGWALPYMFRVNAWSTGTLPGPLDRVTTLPPSQPQPPARATYGYAFEAGSEPSTRMLALLLADSVRTWYAPRSFTSGGTAFPHGAFIVRVAFNEESVHDVVRRHAATSGVRVVAIGSALVDEGTDLGSNSVLYIRPPRIALAGGPPINGNSFGFAWYAFDQRIGYPVTPVPAASLGGAVLDEFDVLVVPSASASGLDGQLGENGRERIGRWVRDGGVLITVDGATSWLATERLGLSRFRLRQDTTRADSTGGAPLPAGVPGAIVRAHTDTLSWLTAGVTTRDVPVLIDTDRIYTAPKDLRAGEIVVRYAPLASLRLTGYLWPEVPERLAETAWLWTERVGRGRVIGFAGDPNFRDMWRGLLPLFANAALLGSSQ